MTVATLAARLPEIFQSAAEVKLLSLDPTGQHVLFHWNERDFLAKTSLDVFELKNHKLFMSAHSVLIQSALTHRVKTKTVLEECVSSLRIAEELLSSEEQLNDGLQVLKSVKSVMTRLKNPNRP